MSVRAEKISRMAGKSTFRDLRDGMARAGIPIDPDADIKAALGMARHRTSELAVDALELRYAGTLRREDTILRAYCADADDAVLARRMAAAVAIREYAGMQVPSRALKRYAWLAHCRADRFRAHMAECVAWLDEQRGPAEQAFLASLDGGEK